MAMHLYPHNLIAYTSAVHMLSERGKAAVIHPTGTGKSFIGFKLCEDNPNKTICWLSPSRYIYQTQLENLAETSDGYQPENVKFYTYAKLMNVSEEEIAEIQPDYIILDEFHRCGAELWGAGVDAVLRAYPDVPVLGLSATAIRYLDNQRDMTDELFDGNVASEMTLGEAIVRGILNPPKYILSVFSIQKDLDKYEQRVHNARYKKMRDEAEVYLEALRRALDHAEKLDVMFDKHMEDRTGKYIVFCANREHMDDMIGKAKEWFAKVDKRPHIYKVYASNPETSKAFADFKSDRSERLKLLYCIDMLNEGVHVEDISGVILLRPTVSPIIYKQQIGRALSASKSNMPVIFDIVNNIENLYSIDTVKDEMQTAIQYFYKHDGSGVVVNENFELIDKVADCKSLFEALEGTLSASWDIMYEKAKEYYEQYGDLEIPKDYYTEDGYSLGIWIITQRGNYRGTTLNSVPLTQVQIDKLTAIGMRWQSINELSWERYFEAAEQYYNTHGDLLPTAAFVDENGIDLGRWLQNQRTARKNGVTKWGLTEERIARLDGIGMVWDVFDYQWEENFSAAVRYHRQHGDLEVPQKYVDSEGFYLGRWLSKLRLNRKNGTETLTEEQKARLDALGMCWEDRFERRWNNNFRELCKYYDEHKTLTVPAQFRTESGANLYAWIKTQRVKFSEGRLSDEQFKKLNSIGFDFTITDIWEENFAFAKKYFEEHGDLNIPATDNKGITVRKWLLRQKKYADAPDSARLSHEQIEKLRSIGLFDELSHTDRLWFSRYGMAKAFYAENGHLNVPKDCIIDGFNLGTWVQTQKQKNKKGVLSQDKIDLLNKLGMNWESLAEIDNSRLYKTGFAHLEKYIAENGLGNVRANTVCEDGYALGNWLTNCRSRYKAGELAEQYVKRFRQLRFPLDDNDRWEYRFQEVKAYFDEHGGIQLPEKLIGDDGTDLSLWLAKQRRAYPKGDLSDEQMHKMDEIGYPFKPEVSPIAAANRKKWQEKYDVVKEFLELHKGEKLDPEVEYKGIKIIEWIRQQRNFIQNGVFDDDRVVLFNALGWQSVLDNLVSHWDIMYEAAVKFYSENGYDAKIEKGIIVDGTELFNWIYSEKKIVNGNSKVKRTPEQLEKLKAIGIEPQTIDRFEKQWLARYEELKTFIEEHGCLPMTRKEKGDENSTAVWLNSQKKKYRQGQLSEDRADKLRKLGIEL
ncbi:Helicase associated domain protein [Ruminococcus albus]|uniref:Type III restriction protein res subunit n=1 Tax=Ruminococcus albus (strain ATCC 27210 / DSM 20455 / JCM 14654 / NCDO 2250 / 7) TaxID=697329 RepID=E6UK60_RUMA7|nr:Helicase associated domain protein [Ruminococcus albus]ADU24056.1 type III restriction protein res subunit [Ruminococcus albus 7 = DSM 20455]